MDKYSCFATRETDAGVVGTIPLFIGATDRTFEKVASNGLLPEVVQYIDTLRPRQDAQYELVNAMGASEFYGQNINHDLFPEASLIHRPDEWTGNPLIDAITAKDWPYGFPTFYSAHAFPHHRNKILAKRLGDVELVAWNAHMRRVELVMRIDRDRCIEHGGENFWTRLKNGEYPDVSMGTRVPWDRCTLCTDMDAYRRALATFDPRRHRHPGLAVLEVHRRLRAERGRGLRGIAENRSEYCDCMRQRAGVILPNGLRVGVYNDYPRFFDISLVFIGADRTAKVMMHVRRIAPETAQTAFQDVERAFAKASEAGWDKVAAARPKPKQESLSDLIIAKSLADEFEGSLDTEWRKPAVGEKIAASKAAKVKRGAIIKDVVPSQFAGKAVPVLTERENDLSRDVLEQLSRIDRPDALSALTALGIILRPREFQQMELMRDNKHLLSDLLSRSGTVFPRVVGPVEACPISNCPPEGLLEQLIYCIPERSCLAPAIERRVIVIQIRKPISLAVHAEQRPASSHTLATLHKLGAAYRDYRAHVMNTLSILPLQVTSNEKLAQLDIDGADIGNLFSPLTVAYAMEAFWNEVGS